LHLKIVNNHENFDAQGEVVPIAWRDYKVVLMPRQFLLNTRDPDGKRSLAEMRELLKPMATDY
jgi:hypothetical protein